MKRLRTSERDSEEERDKLNELPDGVLLHIMNFMNPKYAVQTCILSKRWKDLWKGLTTLSLNRWDFRTGANYNNFVSQVLSGWDDSIPLLNLRFWDTGPVQSKLLNRVMEYLVLHNVQTIDTDFNLRNTPNHFYPFNLRNTPNLFYPQVFSCLSLTSLKLYKCTSGPPLELPKSLQLPALKSLFMANVSFTASENVWAEPFSTCNLLNTLVLKKCSLHSDAEVLFISNSNLSNLNLEDLNNMDEIVLSAPNLSSLIFTNYLDFSYQPLSSTCNLSRLEEGTIHTATNISYSVFIGWLQLLTNVKILTLSYATLMLILKDLSLSPATMRAKLPCFVRLESLKVKMNRHVDISDEEVNRVVKYLLQNSPLTGVAVINC